MMKPRNLKLWQSVSDEERKRLIALYPNITPADAENLGMNLTTLKRRIREELQKQSQPRHKIVPTAPPANDLQTYQKYITGLNADVQIMHMSDIHYPYHHPQALDLSLQLVGYVKPAIIVIGSDEFDFMRLGTFDIDQRHEFGGLDDIDIVRVYHQQLVDRLLAQSPNSKLVWIFGNHDYRLYRYVLKNSPYVANTIDRAFTDMIRYQGRVWYMGETDQIQFNNLVIAHGTRAGLNPAKAYLEMTGYQINYMAGHVHRRTYWQRQGYHYGVQSVTGACLCQLTPHYAGYRADKTNWELGTCIADVPINAKGVHFDNLKFDDSPNGLMVRYHHHTYTSK